MALKINDVCNDNGFVRLDYHKPGIKGDDQFKHYSWWGNDGFIRLGNHKPVGRDS